MRTVDEFMDYMEDQEIFPWYAKITHGNYRTSMKHAQRNLMNNETVRVVFVGQDAEDENWVVLVTNERILMSHIRTINEIKLENLTGVTNNIRDVLFKSYEETFTITPAGFKGRGNKVAQLIRKVV